MPIIITAHMANKNVNSIAFQGAVVGFIRPMPVGTIRKSDHINPMHNAILAKKNFRELTVGSGEFKLDRLGRLGPAAPDFGNLVFEAVHHIDPNPLRRSRYRIEDWLATAF